MKIPTHDKTAKQSSSKGYMKDNLELTPCIPEQSPVLGKRQGQNQKPCFACKKKGELNILDELDLNEIKKQNVNDESRYVQKENICKRRLFENDREQLGIITPQIFDIIDLTKESNAVESNGKETELIRSNNKDSLRDPLSRYTEFCKMISAENFDVDILPDCPDPVTTTMKRLRNTYAESFRQQLSRRKNKRELENVKSAYSVEHQACTSADISQLSPVEFEVPKCNENRTTASRLQIKIQFQKNPDYVSHLLKNKRLDKDNSSIDIPGYENSRRIDNSKHLEASMLNNSVLERHFAKDYSRTKLQIAVSDNYTTNGVPQKSSNETTNKCNVKNVKRIPTILHRGDINKSNHFERINDNYANGLYKKCETNLFRDYRDPSNGIEKQLYENPFENRPTPATVNMMFEQTKILEPQIDSVKIKDSQDSLVEQFDINMYPNKHSGRNEFYQYGGDPPRSFEASNNTNAYIEKLPQQKQISSDVRKRNVFHSNNCHPINNFQDVSFSNFNVEPTKQFPQRTKLHVYEVDKQELRKNIRDQNQNILVNNVNDRAMPTQMLNFPQNVQTEERYAELRQENQLSRIDVERTKNQVNQNAYHCNEQHIYSDSTNCPHKCKEQANYFRKETVQPESLRDTRGYNNSVGNCVNLSSTARNVPLSLIQKNNLCTYPKVGDDRHRAVLLQNVTAQSDSTNCPHKYYKEQANYFHKETVQPESLRGTRDYDNSVGNCVNLPSTTRKVPLSLIQNNNLCTYPKAVDDRHRVVLLQNVTTQPVKYLAVENSCNSNHVQRIPVHISDRGVRIAENVPLKVTTVMDSSTQTFPQEIATVVPLQTNSLHIDDYATRRTSDQSFAKRLDSVTTVLFNPDSQSNIWYASNL
ncbi:PREDICTED: uncharacterized protein LOC105452253 isoform X2 [Wasmannia auropunctata]|nr:PREDICTED: uncharacterized protein LOC105452253 isoform X2 [Wasmannia auropunctata]XP_011691511.1 PREDICTED: uncharacterized protein LOC105452253 isoform X2 [Wasmannia auropunctata]